VLSDLLSPVAYVRDRVVFVVGSEVQRYLDQSRPLTSQGLECNSSPVSRSGNITYPQVPHTPNTGT
jgi:hypothetical protein